jgi:hypothetical protein
MGERRVRDRRSPAKAGERQDSDAKERGFSRLQSPHPEPYRMNREVPVRSYADHQEPISTTNIQ